MAVAATALVLAAPAHARTTHHSWNTMTLTQRRSVVLGVVRRERIPIHRWLHSRSLTDAWPYHFCRALGTPVPGLVCIHGQRLVDALAVLHRIDVKIAARAAATRPAHLAGWLCIHNGRYPGAAHEGNGWSPNGLYSGPLQMSSGWGGYAVSDWNALPEMKVYADAEAVASREGFRPTWMSGQWPNTYPGCADLF